MHIAIIVVLISRRQIEMLIKGTKKIISVFKNIDKVKVVCGDAILSPA